MLLSPFLPLFSLVQAEKSKLLNYWWYYYAVISPWHFHAIRMPSTMKTWHVRHRFLPVPSWKLKRRMLETQSLCSLGLWPMSSVAHLRDTIIPYVTIFSVIDSERAHWKGVPSPPKVLSAFPHICKPIRTFDWQVPTKWNLARSLHISTPF